MHKLLHSYSFLGIPLQRFCFDQWYQNALKYKFVLGIKLNDNKIKYCVPDRLKKNIVFLIGLKEKLNIQKNQPTLKGC